MDTFEIGDFLSLFEIEHLNASILRTSDYKLAISWYMHTTNSSYRILETKVLNKDYFHAHLSTRKVVSAFSSQKS